jgi:hypothetical protein
MPLAEPERAVAGRRPHKSGKKKQPNLKGPRRGPFFLRAAMLGPAFRHRRKLQPPNTTLFMIRPGARVNRPVRISARVKIESIAKR